MRNTAVLNIALLVIVAAAGVGCARVGGSDEANVSEIDFFLDRFPDAPVALPTGRDEQVANVSEAALDESGAVVATEIAFWPHEDLAQKVCVRFEAEPAALPSSCGSDIIAIVDGVEVLGDRETIDSALLGAIWKRVGSA